MAVNINNPEITLEKLIIDAFTKGTGRDRFGRNSYELRMIANNAL